MLVSAYWGRRVAVPQNKTELIEAIDRSFDRLLETLRLIPVGEADQMSLAGHAQGTHMSVANLVAYLVGWNELVLKWNELGRLAGRFYRD